MNSKAIAYGMLAVAGLIGPWYYNLQFMSASGGAFSVAEFVAGDIANRRFVSQTLSVFRKATPLMTFLCAAAEVEF